MNGAERIAAERKRQIEEKGWSEDHDDDHVGGDLAQAAMAYCWATSVVLRGSDGLLLGVPQWWPWDDEDFKPGDPVRMLEKAGALIAAELDRLLRLSP